MTEPAQLLYTCTKGRSKDAIADIFALYVPPPALIADVTCGPRHGFLHEVRKVPGYEFVLSDIEPHGDVRADFRCLPYQDETFDCVLLDPPWGNVSTTQRPSRITSLFYLRPLASTAVSESYHRGIKEASRILKPGGILIVKSQDYVVSGRRMWITQEIFELSHWYNLEMVDQKISVQYAKPPKMWHQKQQHHLRSNHSFYSVFRKRARK